MTRGGSTRWYLRYEDERAVVPVEANEQTAARDEEVVGKTVLWYVFVGPLGLLSLLEKGQDVVVPADSQFYVMVRSQAVVNGRVY